MFVRRGRGARLPRRRSPRCHSRPVEPRHHSCRLSSTSKGRDGSAASLRDARRAARCCGKSRLARGAQEQPRRRLRTMPSTAVRRRCHAIELNSRMTMWRPVGRCEKRHGSAFCRVGSGARRVSRWGAAEVGMRGSLLACAGVASRALLLMRCCACGHVALRRSRKRTAKLRAGQGAQQVGGGCAAARSPARAHAPFVWAEAWRPPAHVRAVDAVVPDVWGLHWVGQMKMKDEAGAGHAARRRRRVWPRPTSGSVCAVDPGSHYSARRRRQTRRERSVRPVRAFPVAAPPTPSCP